MTRTTSRAARTSVVAWVIVACVTGCASGNRRANVGEPAIASGVAHATGSIAATFTRMMDAVNAGNADAYARLYASDAVIHIYGGTEIRGRDAIRKYEVDLLREFPGTRFGIHTIWNGGSSVIVRYGVNSPPVAPTGRSSGHEGLLFYRFQPGGLIEEERRYLDAMTPMAQLGMFGPSGVRPVPTLPSVMQTHETTGGAMETRNIARVRDAFAALNERNRAAYLASVSDDAIVDELVYPRAFVGKPGVREWLASWSDAVPDAAWELNTIVAAGDFVLVESVVRGTLNGTIGRTTATNKSFVVHRAEVLCLNDGRIVRMTGFMNGKELALAVGQWPPAR
jgi:ketosteroid isomerase-like protein